MSLWDALTDIQKKVTEGVEQFQEVFDPNAAVSPAPRARHVSSAAFSVDNDDAAAKRPGEDVVSRRPDPSQYSRDGQGSAVQRPQGNSGGPSRTLATATRDELVALVQRQAAKIQQLQVRLDESNQENQVLRQERDSLKNMLRASDAELTEVKKARAGVQSAVLPSSSKSLQGDASLASIGAESVASVSNLSERDVAKDSQLQMQRESFLQQIQKLQQDHDIVLHAAHQRISFLEQELDNVHVLAKASECRSSVSREDEAALTSLKHQLVESQSYAASLDGVVLELRTKVTALEASLATYASTTAANFGPSNYDASVLEAGISSTSEMSSLTLQNQENASLPANHAFESEHLNSSSPGQPFQDELLNARALAESATAEAATSRAQLSLAETRISELVSQLEELHAAKQIQEGASLVLAHHSGSHQNEHAKSEDTDVVAIRSEMEDLISALDHLSAAVTSVNFPNQPALPTHSLPCHLSKVAFTSFKQLADAVDAVVSQLVRYTPISLIGRLILFMQADVDFNSRQAFKAMKSSSDSEIDKLKSFLSSCRSQLDQMGPELEIARSKIKKLEHQLISTEGLYKTLQSELSSSEQVRQALNLELKRLEQALSSASVSSSFSSADASAFINALQWSQVGEPAGWSIRRRVHVDACVWALICSGTFRFWMAETDLMRHLGEKGVSVGSMFDALPPPIVLDTRDHAAATILKEKQIEIVSLEKKVHELTNELQKLQIKSWVQPQHESSSDFSNQDVKSAVSDVSVASPSEPETDSQREVDRLVMLVGDLERKLAHANFSHCQIVARLTSELETSHAKVAEADAAAREVLLRSEKELEMQFKERIEDIKRKSRVILPSPLAFQRC